VSERRTWPRDRAVELECAGLAVPTGGVGSISPLVTAHEQSRTNIRPRREPRLFWRSVYSILIKCNLFDFSVRIHKNYFHSNWKAFDLFPLLFANPKSLPKQRFTTHGYTSQPSIYKIVRIKHFNKIRHLSIWNTSTFKITVLKLNINHSIAKRIEFKLLINNKHYWIKLWGVTE